MDLSGAIEHVTLYPEDVLPLCVILAVICLIEWIYAKAAGLKVTFSHHVMKLVFAAYLLILFEGTVSLSGLYHTWSTVGFAHKGEVMLEPLKEIRAFWLYGSEDEILFNLIGNIAVFIPMGLLPPLLWKWPRWPWWAACWAVIPSCVIEGLQLFTPRTTSVDDVVLNACGAVIGYLLFWFLWLCGIGRHSVLDKKSKKKKKQKKS